MKNIEINTVEQRKVAIYARVSTKEQAEEGYSIDAQIEACRKKYKGDKQIVVYADRGISGKNIEKREEMKKLLNDIKCGRIERVLVWKLNRLTRSLADTVKIVEDMQTNKVSLECVDQTIDLSTSTGLLNFRILASVAEFERENIVENVKMGMRARARQGEWNGGKVLGYDTQKMGNETKLVVNEQEKQIVERIFRMFIEGNSYRGIARQLNVEGYVSKKNKEFSGSSIRYILSNSVYKGEITFTERKKGNEENKIVVKGKHVPIIKSEIWDKAQILINEKSTKAPRTIEGSALLTGLMKCPKCGASLVIGSAKNKRKDGSVRHYRFYRCSQRVCKGIDVCEFNKCINAELIEQKVINRLVELADNDNLLGDIIDKLNKRNKLKIEPLEQERTKLLKSKREIENTRDKVWELYEQGMMDKEAIASRINYFVGKLKRVESQLDKIKTEINSRNIGNDIDASKVRSILQKVIQEINQKDNQVKKIIMQLVVKNIEVDEQGQVKNIHLKFNGGARDNKECTIEI